MTHEIESHVNSLFNSCSYRIGEVLIDPGDEWEGFRRVKAVLLTHAHFDHIYGLNRVAELNPEVRVLTTSFGREMLMSDKKNMSRYHESPFVFERPELVVEISEGPLSVAGLDFDVFETPGHNPSCLTFRIGEALFTGDAYIPGIPTVTKLPGGNCRQAEESVSRILSLGGRIYPGHFV